MVGEGVGGDSVGYVADNGVGGDDSGCVVSNGDGGVGVGGGRCQAADLKDSQTDQTLIPCQLSHYSLHFQALEIFGQHSGVMKT